jgi:putative FmdB family regulatory protein
MPIYEYRCESCGHELEVLQKMSDAPLIQCPECGESALKKVLSAAAFRLKGGGWYETDFKRGSRKNVHDSGKTDTQPPSNGKADGKASAKQSCSGTSCG